MKKILITLSIVLCYHCSSFKETPSQYHRVGVKNINTINGSYSVFPVRSNNNLLHTANSKFYRKYGRKERDTLELQQQFNYKFNIEILNPDSLKVEIIENEKIVRTQVLKYTLKNNDGFLYIENRNTIIGGVPYLFGGIDIKKVRCTLNSENDIIIQELHHSSGALLFVFGDSKTWEYIHTYSRIR